MARCQVSIFDQDSLRLAASRGVVEHTDGSPSLKEKSSVLFLPRSSQIAEWLQPQTTTPWSNHPPPSHLLPLTSVAQPSVLRNAKHPLLSPHSKGFTTSRHCLSHCDLRGWSCWMSFSNSNPNHQQPFLHAHLHLSTNFLSPPPFHLSFSSLVFTVFSLLLSSLHIFQLFYLKKLFQSF